MVRLFSMFPFHFLGQLTGLDGVWYERFATVGHPKDVLLHFLQSVITVP
jgi:hypothetical protein